MAYVSVIQRHAHLAGPVRLEFVNGREGKVARAVLTAISNTRRSSRGGEGEPREEEATAIQWTLWGKQAENAAEYLGRGSHVNIVGRVRNNTFERDGETVYGMSFTAEEVDYLDSRGDREGRRGASSGEGCASAGASAGASVSASAATSVRKPRAGRQPASVDA